LQFLLENGKKRTFSYKVAYKKFSWSGQRGGHRTVALPQNTPLLSVTAVLNLAPNYHSIMCQRVAENPGRQYLRSDERGDLAAKAVA